MILKNVKKITIKIQDGIVFYVIKYKKTRNGYKVSYIAEVNPFTEFYFEPEALINPTYADSVSPDLVEGGDKVTKAELIMIAFNRGPIA